MAHAAMPTGRPARPRGRCGSTSINWPPRNRPRMPPHSDSRPSDRHHTLIKAEASPWGGTMLGSSATEVLSARVSAVPNRRNCYVQHRDRGDAVLEEARLRQMANP
jgi:hypothetical protein